MVLKFHVAIPTDAWDASARHVMLSLSSLVCSYHSCKQCILFCQMPENSVPIIHARNAFYFLKCLRTGPYHTSISRRCKRTVMICIFEILVFKFILMCLWCTYIRWKNTFWRNSMPMSLWLAMQMWKLLLALESSLRPSKQYQEIPSFSTLPIITLISHL